jgi:3-oxoacyl-[acyl-carrier protein] reductase
MGGPVVTLVFPAHLPEIAMDLGLKDRIAFVAGASAGMGLASAIELAREGCLVAICSRDEERIQDAARKVATEAHGDASRVLPIVCDVTRERQIEAALEQVCAHFGGLNILVTNAGGPPAGFVGDFDADDWRQALELNLISTINLCRHSLRELREGAAKGLGRIIMIASLSAKQPIPNLYLSNAARAGVIGFAKSLAEELGPEAITVNALLPGYTRTERLAELAGRMAERTERSRSEVETSWAENAALKRIGEPEEFAAVLAFLASSRASYLTGLALPVDGGRSKHLL